MSVERRYSKEYYRDQKRNWRARKKALDEQEQLISIDQIIKDLEEDEIFLGRFTENFDEFDADTVKSAILHYLKKMKGAVETSLELSSDEEIARAKKILKIKGVDSRIMTKVTVPDLSGKPLGLSKKNMIKKK